MLALRDIRVAFGGVRALKGVTFDIGEGELLGLIGPNGSGKSTLVNVVTGLQRPDGGSVNFRGRPVHRRSPHELVRLGIRRTFQTPRLYWEVSVARNLEIARLLGGGDDAFMNAFIEHHLPGLATKMAMAATSLSLFEQKVVEVALRLVGGPQVILLDEPGAGLSEEEHQRLIDILRELNRHFTILVIEHSMSIIFTACARVVVLREGLLIADGTPAQVSRDPDVIESYLGAGFESSESGVEVEE